MGVCSNCAFSSKIEIVGRTKIHEYRKEISDITNSNDRRDYTQSIDLHGDTNQNEADSDGSIQDTRDVRSDHPQMLIEIVETERKLAKWDDEHDLLKYIRGYLGGLQNVLYLE